MQMEGERVDLAHERDFALGALTVHPSTREISRSGLRTVIEPRVMQVLVALSRANGAVVSKDDLTRQCWEGRIVGEDAINRVMSRLRRLSEEAAKGIFRVETVTRVGYRLLVESDAKVGIGSAAGRGPSVGVPNRRNVLAGGAAIAGAAGLGGWWWSAGRKTMPSDLSLLLEQSKTAMRYGTPEQTSNAVATLREATRRHPNRAEGWGRLALAYDLQARQSPRAEAQRLFARGQAAAARALEIDRDNADAGVARLVADEPSMRDWTQLSQLCDRAQGRFPEHVVTRNVCGRFLFDVGRVRESSELSAAMLEESVGSPQIYAMHAVKLWALSRLDEADALFDVAMQRWPRHYAVWFSRYKVLNYTGRGGAAQSMLDEEGARPVGVPGSNFALCALETRALRTRNAADIDAAATAYRKAAETGLGYAENGVLFTSAVGRLDDTFAILAKLYRFAESSVPQVRFTKEQGLFTPGRRTTYFLFHPPAEGLRADPRFADVTRITGLASFWRTSGVLPDYRRVQT